MQLKVVLNNSLGNNFALRFIYPMIKKIPSLLSFAPYEMYLKWTPCCTQERFSIEKFVMLYKMTSLTCYTIKSLKL